MDRQRKDVIINEIHYWRESKLLPEQQCQFLLALYSEGEESFLPTKKPITSMLVWVILSQVCFFLSVFILYFTDFVGALQIGFSLFFVLITGLIGYAKRRNVFELPLHVMITTMILFVTSLKLALGSGHSSSIWAVIVFFTVGWFLTAYFWKRKIFYLLAVFVLIMLGIFAFFNR